MRQIIGKSEKCQNCKKRPATREYHDGDTLMRLCGICLRSWRASGRRWDKLTDQAFQNIAPDAWAEEDDLL
jgi:hypothetical protein